MTLWAGLAEPWKVAFGQAWVAYCSGSLPIGAAVVDREGRVVGRGRNRIFESLTEPRDVHSLFGHRLAHAEVNALISLDHKANNVRECVLYTTLEPCALCVGAIRMIGLKEVRYAARDTSAASLALLEATEFMQRGGVKVQRPDDVELEALSIAMNIAAHLWLIERLVLQPPLDAWAAGLPGFDLGRQLHGSGELRRLARDSNTTIEHVLETLVTKYRLHSAQPLATQPVASSGLRPPRHQSSAWPLVLIITGAPASGKTTVGRQLAVALGLPFLSKDLFKEALFDNLGWQDRDWSRRLGGASTALLYRAAEALLEAGQSVALESNFSTSLSTPEFRGLAERYGCRFVQVVCTAPGPVLVERFDRRARSGVRHPGHTDADSLGELLPRLLAERWDALDLEGPLFTVDTSDGIAEIEKLVADISHACAEA